MYTYTYIYTYTSCHIRVPSNKNFPSVIKVVTLAFIAWKNSFIFIAAYCLLLSSIFIAYLLYQTECDGRLGNQMSVYATAWVKHKVCLKRQPSHIYVDFLVELFLAPSGALVFILVYYIHTKQQALFQIFQI